MSKKSILIPILSIFLFVLVGVKAWQKWGPLHPSLVSINDNKRNMALARLVRLNKAEKAKLFPKLVHDLSSPDPLKRRYALYALRKAGLAQESDIEKVAGLLSDSDAEVRKEAEICLGEVGSKALPHLVKTLGSESSVATQSASDMFRRLGHNTLPELLTVFQKPGTVQSQINALSLISEWGPSAVSAASHLVPHLSSENTGLRRKSAVTLVALSSETEKALPVLISFLVEPLDKEVVNALGSLGLKAKQALPALNKLLQEGKDSFKNETATKPLVARALEKIDPRRTAFTDLGFDLKQKNPLIRYRAAFTISEMKNLDVGVLPMLLPALEDVDPFVLGRVIYALVRVGLKNTEGMSAKINPRLISSFGKISEDKHIEGYRDTVAPAVATLGMPFLLDVINALRKNQISLDDSKRIVSSMTDEIVPLLKASQNDVSPAVKELAQFGLERLNSASSPQ